jgi:hypothetical protein
VGAGIDRAAVRLDLDEPHGEATHGAIVHEQAPDQIARDR